MATKSDLTENEVISSLKKALEHEKSNLLERTLNRYNFRDLSRTFAELDQLVEDAVKAKYGGLQDRPMYEQGKLYPILERIMQRTNSAIDRRLTPRMSKIHPWVIRCDVAIPREVFNLHKSILGESRYGLGVSEDSRTMTLNFTKFRRLMILIDLLNVAGLRKSLRKERVM